MKEMIDADMFRLEMKTSYSPVYMACIEKAKKDLRAKARPELVSIDNSIAGRRPLADAFRRRFYPAKGACIGFRNRSAIGVKLWYLFQIRYNFTSRCGESG